MVAAAAASGRRALRHLALALRAGGGAGEGLARRPRGRARSRIVWKEDVRRWHPGPGLDLAAGGLRRLRSRHQRAVDPDRDPARRRSWCDEATLVVPGEPRHADRGRRSAMTGAGGLSGRPSSSTGGSRGRRAGTSPSRPTAAGSTLSDGGAAMRRRRRARSTRGARPRVSRASTAASPSCSRARESDVDASPLRICADAFLIGPARLPPSRSSTDAGSGVITEAVRRRACPRADK